MARTASKTSKTPAGKSAARPADKDEKTEKTEKTEKVAKSPAAKDKAPAKGAAKPAKARTTDGDGDGDDDGDDDDDGADAVRFRDRGLDGRVDAAQAGRVDVRERRRGEGEKGESRDEFHDECSFTKKKFKVQSSKFKDKILTLDLKLETLNP